MKKFFSLAVVLFVLFVSLGTVQAVHSSKKGTLLQVLTKRETALWEAWKNHQAGPFESALSADSVLMSDAGPSGKAQAIKDITDPQCVITDYALSDFKVTMFDKDAALLTYKATQHVTCGG